MDEEQLRIKFKIVGSKKLPFLSNFIFNSTVEFVDKCPGSNAGENFVAGTNGTQIFIKSNPAFLEEGNFQSSMGIYIHELLHMAFRHMDRFNAVQHFPEEHLLHNILCDAIVNEYVHQLGYNVDIEKYVKGAKGSCIRLNNVKNACKQMMKPGKESDKALDEMETSSDSFNADKEFMRLRPYLNKVAVMCPQYAHAGNKESKDGQTNEEQGGEAMRRELEKRGFKVFEDSSFGKDFSGEQKKKAQELGLKDSVSAEMMKEQMRGTNAGKILEAFSKVWMKREVDWTRIIKNTITSRIKCDRTYHKLHRKTFDSSFGGMIFPGYKRKEKYSVFIGIDNSGSMGHIEMKKFFNEIEGLVTTGVVKMKIAIFDTEVQKYIEVDTESREARMSKNGTQNAKEMYNSTIKEVFADLQKMYGRGGTSFKSTFELARKHKAKDVVIFTDLEGDQNNISKPPFNVTWIVTGGNNDKPPFGKVIHVETS